MKLLAEITTRNGGKIKVARYEKRFQEQVMGLFRKGYPISFDGNDLRKIKKIVQKTDKTFVLAYHGDELVGCMTGAKKIEGPNGVYMGEYLFVRKEFRHYGVATILLGVIEEILKDKARMIVGINTGILPDYELSYGWFENVGFSLLGVVKYWFRADLPGVFMGKVNPYIALGKEIPINSTWDPAMSNSITGEKITKEEYDNIINDPGQAPEAKWGFGLLRSEGMAVAVPCHL